MRTLLAVDFDLPVPGRLVHEVSHDGLTLHSRFESACGGTVEAAVSWRSLAEAEANYARARQGAVDRAPVFARRLGALGDGGQGRSRVRVLARTERGTLSLYTNIAPPTWWLPRLRLLLGRDLPDGRRRYGVRGGWLRLAAQIDFTTPRRA